MGEDNKHTIGRYEISRSLGKGSQGSVYLGRDPTLDRPVAVKVLTSQDAKLNGEAEDGTPLEARISGQLKHPNIVPIFDAGVCDIGPYLVFEYIDGQTLADMLKDTGPTSIEWAAPVISAILQGMSVAHSSQVLHLDLNPRNILIDNDDVPRVMDFGLARFVSIAVESGQFATGTLRYMAPEHFLGGVLDPGTDVFGLGSTFFELVTGQRAMQGTSLEQIKENIIDGAVDFSPIHALEHGEAFGRFLAGALEKKPAGRYGDAATMSEAFDLFLAESGLDAGLPGSGSNHSTIDFLLRRMQRNGDFPTMSRTLADVNRLTGPEATAGADKIANVILRDFALTGKLLKLVNSAFYGVRASEVTSITDAIVFLGIEKVQMTANSLSLFQNMKSDSSALKDSMTRSFLSGLISRHLAGRLKLELREEAFICGMCQNLGENLVICYFPDEYEEIVEAQRAEELDMIAASRGVLGVAYDELGHAVAKSWKLPGTILAAIRGVPHGKLRAPQDEEARLRDLSVFANELAGLFSYYECDDISEAMQALLTRFDASVDIGPDYCTKLVLAAFDHLQKYAPIFEINVIASDFCRSVQTWLDLQIEDQDSSSVAENPAANRVPQAVR